MGEHDILSPFHDIPTAAPLQGSSRAAATDTSPRRCQRAVQHAPPSRKGKSPLVAAEALTRWRPCESRNRTSTTLTPLSMFLMLSGEKCSACAPESGSTVQKTRRQPPCSVHVSSHSTGSTQRIGTRRPTNGRSRLTVMFPLVLYGVWGALNGGKYPGKRVLQKCAKPLKSTPNRSLRINFPQEFSRFPRVFLGPFLGHSWPYFHT